MEAPCFTSSQQLQCFFHFIGCDFVFADIVFGCCFYFGVSQSMFEFGDWGVTGGEERGVGVAEVMVFEVDTEFLQLIGNVNCLARSDRLALIVCHVDAAS